MIIKKLTLHNFGVYAGTNTFEFRGDKPVVLIGGMNGRGKTTFLEAVLIAMYGSNSFAYNESPYNSFGQYLKSFVNKSDGTLQSYIELSFMLNREESDRYTVRTEWDGTKKRIAPNVVVYKNGAVNPFLTDNWSMFIENLLPSGLSSFFFFDGEKIIALAEQKTDKQWKESIKALLGITVLDSLEKDLNRIREKAEISSNDEQYEQLENERLTRNQLADELQMLDARIDNIAASIDEKQKKLEEIKAEYAVKGGEIVADRQKLIDERNAASAQATLIREQLIADASTALPLYMLKNSLFAISEKAESEQEERVTGILIKRLEELQSAFIGENADAASSVRSFIEYVYSQIPKSDGHSAVSLSEGGLYSLKELLAGKIDELKESTLERQQSLKQLEEKVNQYDNYLAVEIDEKALARLYKEMRIAEQAIIDLQLEMRRAQDERQTVNGGLIKASAQYQRDVEAYLKTAEISDDQARMNKYIHLAQTVLEKYRIRLQEKKIDAVASTMTYCFRQLASKRSLIKEISIDPVSLEIFYLDSTGHEVAHNSLSAGEKQLMVVSLLWSLALCSKKKLPVIIDTPLSRLDSSHRAALVKTYFPNASDQTIILSTDSEIDHGYREMMKDHIGDEYTLIYDDTEKSTTIKRGYFVEAQR